MAKSRDKIQQLGFWDPEVSNPDHDDICLWAYHNAHDIFQTVVPSLFNRDWDQSEILISHEERTPETIRAVEQYTKATPRPNPRVVGRSLEHVLKSSTGYRNNLERIVGYADLHIRTSVPLITSVQGNKTRLGFNVLEEFEVNWSEERYPGILVEAKSVLPTIGELMRQIQLYRTAFGGPIVVISPDTKYAEILREQEVAFIQYAPDRA